MQSREYPDSYYAATAGDGLNCAALAGELRADVAIVGGGFTGISAALELAARGYSVVVLEARRVGWGASGRNGGQLLAGGFGDPEQMERRHGATASRLAAELGRNCVHIVRKRITASSIDCDFKTGSFSAAVTALQLRELRRRFDTAKKLDDSNVLRWYTKDSIGELIGSERYLGGIFNADDGHLHPLKLCLAEARLAMERGVKIFERSPVTAFERQPTPVVKTRSGLVRANYLLICCNAYLDGLAPELSGRVLAAGSFIVATQALSVSTAKRLLPGDCAVADENVLLDYYRLSADRRLLFGGRYSYRGSAPADIETALATRMRRVFPDLGEVGIDYAWGGKIGISLTRLPQFGRITPSIYYAHGYSGHGVAQTHMAGRLLAEAVAGQAERFDVFAAMKSPRLPGGDRYAPVALALALMYYGLKDALGR